MQVKLKNKRFYVNLPSRLYSELKEFSRAHETMDLDLAVLILHFIIKQQSECQEWVPLSSVILRKYDHGGFKSSEQVELLKEGGFIEYLNHQNNIPGKENSCRKFRISLEYFEQEKDASTPSIHTHEIRQKPLLKKLEKHNRHRKIEASSTTPHLTKWLESNKFSIDREEAHKFIDNKYTDGDYSGDEYFARWNKIINFDPAQSYSRDGRDDRLHSIFTQLASELKKFVKHNGQQLVEVDIKSSQPLMFALLLEKILYHYTQLDKSRSGVTAGRLKNRINKSVNNWVNNEERSYYKNDKYVIDIESISYSITIILLETFKSPDFAEIKRFISLVSSGSIYEHISEYLLSMGIIWKGKEKYHTRLFNKKENKQEVCGFSTLRDCGKQILLNALYSPTGRGSVNAINKVKEKFSSVFDIVDAFKIFTYKDLSLILQRMEAKCVLDHCAKNIAKTYPDMPLICRHDSISTTAEFGNALYGEFKKQVESYFGTSVRLEKDVW